MSLIGQLIMGPVTNMFQMKNKVRNQMGLVPLTEDTHKIAKLMKASNLPTSPADLLDMAQPLGRASRAGRLAVSGQGPRQGSFAGGRSKLLATSVDDPPNKSFRNSLMLGNASDQSDYLEDNSEDGGEEATMADGSGNEEDSLFDVGACLPVPCE